MDFDEGYISEELTQNGWLVDNFNGVQGGQAALRPPPVAASGTASTTLTVSSPHNQVSFFWAPGAANNCCGGQLSVDFQIDGMHHSTLTADGGGWRQVNLVVSPGAHTYTFVYSAQVGGIQDGFLFDSFLFL